MASATSTPSRSTGLAGSSRVLSTTLETSRARWPRQTRWSVVAASSCVGSRAPLLADADADTDAPLARCALPRTSGGGRGEFCGALLSRGKPRRASSARRLLRACSACPSRATLAWPSRCGSKARRGLRLITSAGGRREAAARRAANDRPRRARSARTRRRRCHPRTNRCMVTAAAAFIATSPRLSLARLCQRCRRPTKAPTLSACRARLSCCRGRAPR